MSDVAELIFDRENCRSLCWLQVDEEPPLSASGAVRAVYQKDYRHFIACRAPMQRSGWNLWFNDDSTDGEFWSSHSHRSGCTPVCVAWKSACAISFVLFMFAGGVFDVADRRDCACRESSLDPLLSRFVFVAEAVVSNWKRMLEVSPKESMETDQFMYALLSAHHLHSQRRSSARKEIASMASSPLFGERRWVLGAAMTYEDMLRRAGVSEAEISVNH